MAQSNKARSSRRSSSSSSPYTSTLTTLIFIALCVLGIWMLTSNSVVTPKTRTSVDENNSETINTDLAATEDTPETTTTTTTATSTTNIPNDQTDQTTSNISEDQSHETTTNPSEESRETNTDISEESSRETSTKSQDQKATTVFGDNPGNLPDDAIKTMLAQKHDVSSNANDDVGSNRDQKITENEKEAKTARVSEGKQKGEEENNIAQDENINANANQNTETENASASENQEEGTAGGGQHSFDVQGSKNSDDEANVQQLREDAAEVIDKEQKERVQDEGGETEKPKMEKNNRRKSNKEKKELSTQADEFHSEETRKKGAETELQDLKWSLCNAKTGFDYIPCLDNEKYLRTSRRKHYEHRERHCPEDAPTCLVPIPPNYKTPIKWPSSRDKIWYHNIPHTLLAEVKGHQNWVKLTGEFLTFPGGGTQFIHGALHYIDFLQQAEPSIAWGKHTRVILDVGCGVGSLGGYLFERDVIAMSFAPKDEHEAQVQFALERGIPAISAVMGTQRLQFPSNVFDLVHCARCRVPWHEDGGLLLLELDRVLRPGGYFVWCATPVYQTIEEDAKIWQQMSELTKSMCWELVTIKKDALNQVGAAFYRKPTSNECLEQRKQNQPPICKDDDDPNAAWYVPLQACMHKLPVFKAERGTRWPEPWPLRHKKVPYWVEKQASQEFAADNERWINVVDELSNIGVTWSNVRNIMDMRATFGGFAAALKDLPVWVFNVVNVDASDTLPIIYERGFIGMYHDWCESFSTYPRTYDLLHADHLFSNVKYRCNLVPVIAEVDRILRPGGNLIVRDKPNVIGEVGVLLKSLHWEVTSTIQEGLLCGKKGMWRPKS
ncbi:hypothetical protein Fmac_014964 [Flemingia macrophylla]|uniref:Methyltransferase PMT27 n=1 Tax=Flemingia macrophylla TaxID=520843 RepID=A0ABD1MD91_9FABA